MKKLLLFLIIIISSLLASAQDFPHDHILNEELEMKKYDKDTSARAVVLQEYGSSRIDATSNDEIRLLYNYHVKIKFFDNKEFENHGTIEVPFYTGDGQTFEEVDDIVGITYYTDENGGMHKAELDQSKIFKVQENKHWSTLKFAMPALRNGCVIEVSYRIISPYIHNFHSWNFQNDIPKISSRYEVHIPGYWDYNASLKGGLKLSENKAELERECFSFRGAKADCSHMTYGMTDIPAFIEEDYMTSAKNFISSINFELQEYTDMSSGAKIKVTKTWPDIDRLLRTESWFGGQLKRKGLMKDKITPVIANKTNDMDKAKAIYTYFQKTIKWDQINDLGSEDGIRKAMENHTGNSGDINLALIAALNTAGVPTEAVLLSTREHGGLNRLYPNIGDFNYVIAKVNIGDKSYFLDATDIYLPFGMLPLRCLNDQGRAVSLDKPSYWVDLVTNQRESVTRSFDLTLQDNGKLKGTMIVYSAGYDGYLKRKEIKKFNSTDEYVENFAGKLGKIKISDPEITNIDSLDKPVMEKYNIVIDAYSSLNNTRLEFNPVLFERKTLNPFKLAERTYPVDWGMPSDERYILSLHLPSQFTVENPPQNLALTIPNQGGKYIVVYQSGDNNSFTFSNVTQFNKSIYSAEEYPYLKELYNKMILSEKTELTFKKTL